jgi:adenylate cyclase
LGDSLADRLALVSTADWPVLASASRQSPRRRRPERGRRLTLLVATAATAALAGGIVSWTSVLRRVENDTLNARFAVRGHQPPGPFTIVGIDDKTLAAPGIQRWPWPRSLQGRLVRAVLRLHPRLIVYDIQITEPTTAAQDLALYSAISAARPVVMVTSEVGPRGATQIFGGDENVRRAGALPAYDGVPDNSDELVDRLDAGFHGLRSVPLVAAGALGHPVHLAPGAAPLIDYPGGRGTVPEIPAIDILDGRVPASRIRGRIAVIGVPAESVGDIHPTDAGGGSLLSGSEIQADSIATALAGFPLGGAPGWLDAGFVLFSALLAPLAATTNVGYLGVWIALAWGCVLAGIAQLAFDGGTVLAVMPPLTAVLVSAIGVGVVDLTTVRRERAMLVATFARYVPSDHVQRVVERAEQDAGLAEELDATVMFCDLRGYTGFAERLSAQEVLEALNTYLGQVSDAVMDQGGSVVTFLGDGVMAVFGAPLATEDHPTRALAAACAVVAAVGADRVGVGLSSGRVVSGTVGSGRRMEYAAIGDTTNVAARVQALTREVDRPILLTEATAARLADPDAVESLGEFKLRGREEPIVLYGIREPGEPMSPT